MVRPYKVNSRRNSARDCQHRREAVRKTMALKMIVFASALFCLAPTCDDPRVMERLQAYQAYPVNPETLATRTNYLKVTFRLPPQMSSCAADETGNAWFLLVHWPGGEEKTFTAVRKGNELVAILFEDAAALKRARAVIISHDALFCYDATGQENYCGNPDGFDWQSRGSLLGTRLRAIWPPSGILELNAPPQLVEELPSYVKVVEVGSQEDEETKAWLREIVSQEMAARYGTTLSESQYRALLATANGQQFMAVLAQGLRSAVVPFAQFAALTAINWQLALLNFGVTELTLLIGAILEIFAPEDLNYPEYGKGRPTNRDVAQRLRRLAVCLGEENQRLRNLLVNSYNALRNDITEADDTAAEEAAELREEVEELRQRLEALESLVQE